MWFPLLWKINMKKKNLHHIKFSGFKVPDHYFDSFDELLLNRLKESNTLEGIQNSGFKVPEQYFETFDDKLAKAMSSSEKDVKVIPFVTWRKVAYVSGIAASIVLIIGLFSIFYNKPTFGNLETASIESYIVDEDFTDEDISSLLSEDLTMDNFMDSHLSDSNLENYILNSSSIEDLLKE